MKRTFIFTTLFGLAACAGCDPGTTGGPGATAENNRTPAIQPDDSFRLDVPNLATSLKQGESKTLKIGLNRTKNFDEDVRLAFANIPVGVNLEPSKPTIKPGEEAAVVTITAAEDAAIGDFSIDVTGTPSSGPAATSQFTIKIAQR